VAIVVTIKGHIAAATYKIRSRISTACQIFPVPYNRPRDFPQNCPVPGGRRPLHNTQFLGHARAHIPNGISIDFVGITVVRKRHTDTKTTLHW